jgi:hypothetical protein
MSAITPYKCSENCGFKVRLSYYMTVWEEDTPGGTAKRKLCALGGYLVGNTRIERGDPPVACCHLCQTRGERACGRHLRLFGGYILGQRHRNK